MAAPRYCPCLVTTSRANRLGPFAFRYLAPLFVGPEASGWNLSCHQLHNLPRRAARAVADLAAPGAPRNQSNSWSLVLSNLTVTARPLHPHPLRHSLIHKVARRGIKNMLVRFARALAAWKRRMVLLTNKQYTNKNLGWNLRFNLCSRTRQSVPPWIYCLGTTPRRCQPAGNPAPRSRLSACASQIVVLLAAEVTVRVFLLSATQ